MNISSNIAFSQQYISTRCNIHTEIVWRIMMRFIVWQSLLNTRCKWAGLDFHETLVCNYVTAYLASRRGSRDSQCSNISNVTNEDVGPLNFNAHPRGRQRRTSNFLELPGECIYNYQICISMFKVQD